GFGESPPLPDGVEPTPAAIALAIAALLDDLGLDTPHVAGNSLGGWVALELAAVRPVASLTLLAPAGLWSKRTPLYCRVTLGVSHWLAQHGGRLLDAALGTRPGRQAVLGHVVGHPARMTPEQARVGVRALADGP